MNWGNQNNYQAVKAAVYSGAGYDRIFETVLADVRPLIARHGVPETEREDVLQEICIAVLQNLASFVVNSETLSPSQRNSWLRTLAERRINDFWRSYYREEKTLPDNGADAKTAQRRKISLSALDGEDGEERDIPQEQRELLLLEEEDLPHLFAVLEALLSVNTAPDKMLAFLFNKIILADYAGIIKNKTAYIAEQLHGKRLGVIYAAARVELERTLDTALPDRIFTTLRARLAEEKDGIVYENRLFDMTPRAITDSSNWIKGRFKELINNDRKAYFY